MLQLDLESSVIFANAVSGYYVRTGTSARQSDIDTVEEVEEKARQLQAEGLPILVAQEKQGTGIMNLKHLTPIITG